MTVMVVMIVVAVVLSTQQKIPDVTRGEDDTSNAGHDSFTRQAKQVVSKQCRHGQYCETNASETDRQPVLVLETSG